MNPVLFLQCYVHNPAKFNVQLKALLHLLLETAILIGSFLKEMETFVCDSSYNAKLLCVPKTLWNTNTVKFLLFST